MPDESQSSEPGPHEHQWVYAGTYSDWWDGDDEDTYECLVAGCRATQTRYASR